MNSDSNDIARILFMFIPVALIFWCAGQEQIKNTIWIWTLRKRMRELGYRFNPIRREYMRLVWKDGDEEIRVRLDLEYSSQLKSYDAYIVDSRGGVMRPRVILMEFRDSTFEESLLRLETREIEEATGLRLLERLPFMSGAMIDEIVRSKDLEEL